MGCAGSKGRQPEGRRSLTIGSLTARSLTARSRRRRHAALQHAALPLLTKLDDKLADALHASAIKLLDADFLRSEGSEAWLPRILRRQELEAMEQAQGSRIFLSADEAVAALRAKKRSIAALTYGWTTPDDPDVTGAYLAAMRRFLRSPLGAHVTALFWE